MEKCPHCSAKVSEIDVMCPTCGAYLGPPNVRAVGKQEQRDALEARYLAALEQSKIDGCESEVVSFDESMRKTSAVVNVDLDFLHAFITNDKAMYTTYELAEEGQARRPAQPEDDSDRRTIGTMFFGKNAKEIRYAALSLYGAGLKSYGPYALKFREIMIADRATLLENNSYTFISKHDIKPRQGIPQGYRALWEERHKLAVAKLSGEVSAGTSEAEHSKILMADTGDRATDEFIEIHIYGRFNIDSIESVRGSSSVTEKTKILKKLKMAQISIVQDYLEKAGQEWVEE